MRRLLIVCLVLMSSAAIAELQYDASTGKFYSKGASRKVDQNEYNNLWNLFVQYGTLKGGRSLTAAELAEFFSVLRIKGSPAALRLMSDLEDIWKKEQKDLRRINNL